MDEKGDGPAGPPQGGEKADEHQDAQHHQRGAGPLPRHTDQRPEAQPPAQPHQGEAHQPQGQPPGQGPPQRHTGEGPNQKYSKCGQKLHGPIPFFGPSGTPEGRLLMSSFSIEENIPFVE